MLVEPDLLRQFVFTGTKQLTDQAKSYGLTVIHHSCGSIFPVIDDLISIGVDCIHPIQALAKDMEPEKLKQHFGNRVAFCGGVDARELLVNGSADDVYRKVMKLKEIFPTGLIISPSHEAVLPDIAPGNLNALFKAVKNQV
jgi:uroporphyrinogen decarboxylase